MFSTMKDSLLRVTEKNLTAVITDIQRFSVHDGPGIRTVIFFKGCPLSCLWCQNPETTKHMPEIFYAKELCIGCGACIEACPYGFISVSNDNLVTDARCKVYGICASVCPTKARKVVGTHYSVDRLIEIIRKDWIFYKNSGGGVTLSGGEPTFQHRFVISLLSELRKEKIHSALETCGYAPQDVFKKVILLTDLILFDLKHWDTEKHTLFTGVGNELILRNLDMALDLEKEVVIRFPLIPGVNDDYQSLVQISKICKTRNIKYIHLLPFHQAGRSKWYGLNRKYVFDNYKSLQNDQVERAKIILETEGLEVNVGGNY